MSKEFILAGKSVVFEGDVEKYNNLYWHFQKHQNSYVDSFISFLKNSNNVDELSQTVLDKAINHFSLFYKSFSEFYIAHGFIDFSPEYLTSDEELLFEVMKPFMEVYYKLNQGLGLISDFDKKAAFNRDLNKALRGRIVGGGFGISGAAKGMLQAGAINVATGLAYDGLNVFSKMKADDKIKDMKSDLHNNIRCELLTSYQITISRIFIVVLHQLDVHVNYDDKKAANIIANIKNGSISGKQLVENALVEALKLDPYTPSTYKDYLNLTSNGENGIKEIAKFFRIDISSLFKFNGKEFDTHEEAQRISMFNAVLADSIDKRIKFTYSFNCGDPGNKLDLILNSHILDISLTAINYCIEVTQALIEALEPKDQYVASYLNDILNQFKSKKEKFYQKYINQRDLELFCKKSCQNNIRNDNNEISTEISRNISAANHACVIKKGLYIGDLFPHSMYDEFPECKEYEPYVYLKGNMLLCSSGLYIYDDDRDLRYFEHSWDGGIRSLKCDHIWCGEQILVNNVLIGYGKTSIHNEHLYPEKEFFDSAIYAIKNIISDERFTITDKCDEDTEKGSKILFARQKEEIKEKRRITESNQKLLHEIEEKEKKEKEKQEALAAEKATCLKEAYGLDIIKAKAEIGNYEKWSKMYDERKNCNNHENLKLITFWGIAILLGYAGFLYAAFCMWRLNRNINNFKAVRLIKTAEGDEYVSDAKISYMARSWI